MTEHKSKKDLKSAFHSTTFDADISIHVEKDLNDVGSATISPSGRDVAIASKSGLEIIDLDSLSNPPRHLRYGQSWLVADAQWSPFAARENWVASASNQKALIWNLTMSEDSKQGAIEHTLHAHSRAITDINFSAHHPDILSTCAVDGYVHCWDLRRPTKPVMTFCDWDAGATQVKWNRQDSHILASSHDRWLRIWDDRKGAYPLRSIEAHESKIYGIDWNRWHSTKIATCSLDKSIKFWDFTIDSDAPERIIRTDFPVWRARHTPFGLGMLAMPQDVPGNLHLFDLRRENNTGDDSAPAAKVFAGHGEKQVKEFLWRSRGGISDSGTDEREFQLVSWGTDHELRLQRVDEQALGAVGYVKGATAFKNINVTRQGATYKTFRGIESINGEREKVLRPYSGESAINPAALSDASKTMTLPKYPRRKRESRDPAVPEPGKRNQIGWMSGIKFSAKESKAEALSDKDKEKSLATRRLSMIGPNFRPEMEINDSESLHDEIIRVHKLYSKVSFDDVNMEKRSVSMSLNGPWGEAGDSVYLTATINFPTRYPESKMPVFTFGRSQMISESTYDKLNRETQQIANSLIGRKRGCLEATICYLLGDVDLQESNIWFANGSEVEDVDAMVDESSSEDEEMPAGTSAMMSQELDTSASEGLLAPPARHANVPLPRFCGAVFANNGRLVCFFPPKEEKVKSLLRTMNIERGRPRGEPSFNSFSRLKSDMASSRSKFSSLTEEDDDDEDSDSSDQSHSSSSSDSDSSHFRMGVTHDFWRKIRPGFRKTLSTNRSQKSSTVGTGTGTGVSKGRNAKSKNTISLYDFSKDLCADRRDLLPAKKELGNDYAIYGEGSDVCHHNANIAESYGYQERADIWRYVAILLEHEVPLEILNQTRQREPVLVIARDMIRRCRRESGSDSGVDMSYDGNLGNKKMSGRVKWGHNPLAKYLIDELFDHFQEVADIQMLAMLSCVFSEPAADAAPSHASIGLSQPETPMSMKTPAFSLDYFPTDALEWHTYQEARYNSTGSTPKSALTPSGLSGSLGSSGSPWGSDPHQAISCENTPPLRSRRGSVERLHQISHSLSTSPDDTRGFRRANTGLGHFAANFRPFSATAPSSPPNRKRVSPVEQIISSLAPGVTWGTNTILESVREQPRRSQPSNSDEDRLSDEMIAPGVTGIHVTMHNQNLFDDEGCMSIPLLNVSHSALFSQYRSAYAQLLLAWGLQFQHLEILKFNGLPGYFTQGHTAPISTRSDSLFADSVDSNDANTITYDKSPTSPILLGKKEVPPQQDLKGLDITAYCLKHDSRLIPLSYTTIPATHPVSSTSVSTIGRRTSIPPHPVFTSSTEPGGAVGRCDRCDRVKRQLLCTICVEPVSSSYSPCLSCGCVTHQQCLSEYQASGETRCPGGCECECVHVAARGVVEGWEVMMGVLEMGLGKELAGETEVDNGMMTVSTEDLERDKQKDREWENVGSDGPMDLKTRSRTLAGGRVSLGGKRGESDKNRSGAVSPVGGARAASPSAGYAHLGKRLGQNLGGGMRRKGSMLKGSDGN